MLVHDAQDAIQLIARHLQTSPEIRAIKDETVKTYPDGWPSDLGAFGRHRLRRPARPRVVERAPARLNRNRRLAKDFEHTIVSAIA
jgi:hypothetical protein